MKLFLTILALISLGSIVRADKLVNRYLPPQHASSSGGHSGFLQSPSYQQQQQQQHHSHYQPQQSSHYGTRVASGYATAASSASAHHQAYNRNPVAILRNTASNDGNGNYNFGFETGNGIRRDETGVYEPGHPDGSQTVTGSYSYVGDDGKTYTVNYRADSSGFHAEGDHLPTPPPIPQEIAESLAVHRHSSHGGHGGHSGGYNGGYGGHAAASSQQPASKYLPPQQQKQQQHQQQRGYNYGPRHY